MNVKNIDTGNIANVITIFGVSVNPYRMIK